MRDGVDAAVVELDPLADPVRAGAEDDDPRLLRTGVGLVLLAPGRVEVVGARLDLGGAGVHAPVDRPDAPGAARPAHLVLALGPGVGEVGVRPAEALQPQPVRLDEVRAAARGGERVPRAADLLPEPGVQALRQVVERRPGRADAGLELAGAHGLQEGLGERPADAHRLADRLHLRPQLLVGPGELLEGEARELDDDVVERRLEARRRRPGEVVRDLVQRVPDGELGGDFGDRVAGGLARERGGAGDARIHLDHA